MDTNKEIENYFKDTSISEYIKGVGIDKKLDDIIQKNCMEIISFTEDEKEIPLQFLDKKSVDYLIFYTKINTISNVFKKMLTDGNLVMHDKLESDLTKFLTASTNALNKLHKKIEENEKY